MVIFAWILMVLSSIGFLMNLPAICNSKFLKGLYMLASNAANTFFFVAYLFLSLDPGFFHIYTWGVLIFSALSCLVCLLVFDSAAARALSLFSYAPQIVFYVLVLLA